MDFSTLVLSANDDQALVETLGYLNFSSGKPDFRFQKNLNHFFALLGDDRPWERFRVLLEEALEREQKRNPTFQNSAQAEAVIDLVFDEVAPTYRLHHADLLFHLQDEDFESPFLLARMFEAALAQGPPWEETARIARDSVNQLNDFLGHRPVAVLESGRQMQPFSHERFRPVPLYLAGAGVAVGRHHDLITHALDLLSSTPKEVLADAHFDLELLDEIALDVRAYDHQHPMYKRTNYMFGEWDPHQIDNKGRYRRFVIRAIVLDALADWMERSTEESHEEILFEAAAALSGTILMASTISGFGPNTYDSTVSLRTLLTRVARQRDAFYTRLLQSLTGSLGERLQREALQVKQPFGKVRQHLNLFVAHHGARQVQHSHLAYLYARMGYAEAARQEARVIPAVSTRFECELEWRMTAAHRHLDRGELTPAAALIPEIENLLHRGIDCGAFVDPWNILGFQGNFPLFHSREDSVQDPRAERLALTMEQIFSLYCRTVSIAAADGDEKVYSGLLDSLGKLAAFWDKFATTTVNDIPDVSGEEHRESAEVISGALAEWHAAGKAAGDISFWRKRVERFASAKSYALVLEVLLQKKDNVAALGLLMQWLSQADFVGLESASFSFRSLMVRWMRMVTHRESDESLDEQTTSDAQPERDELPGSDAREHGVSFEEQWTVIQKLFDYLEANADDYWQIPPLQSFFDHTMIEEDMSSDALDGLDADFDEGDEDDEDDENLFSAAYDDVIFRDSARDGNEGETLGGGGTTYDTDLDELSQNLEDRLRFQVTLARLWQHAAAGILSKLRTESQFQLNPEQSGVVVRWFERTRELQHSLLHLMNSIWNLDIPEPSGDHDSLIEYDRQLQLKFSLLNSIAYTHVCCQEASRDLVSCVPQKALGNMAAWERKTATLFRAVHRGKPGEVRKLLPQLVDVLAKRPLLYVPLDKGGDPQQLLTARTLQSVIRTLLKQLPRLGLYRETWHLLRTAQRMERNSVRGATVITEFDRLFNTAFENSLEGLARQSKSWKTRDNSQQLVELIGTLTEHYLELWLEHSATMRLSSLESIRNATLWKSLKEFITSYGQDFFHAPVLNLGNLRAILHNGVEPYLRFLEENQDPLHPVKLLEDLEDADEEERRQAISFLELIFRATVEKYDRFMEYNTTTTRSDYGEQFHVFLDFLRVEASYERQAWNLSPLVNTHRVLVRAGETEAAEAWRNVFAVRTMETADRHTQWLKRLEKRYGVSLPSITDLVSERFIRPLALDQILALVPQAMRVDRDCEETELAFEMLQQEISDYSDSTTGSGLDIPLWLRSVENEVFATVESQHGEPPTEELPAEEFTVLIPTVNITLNQLRKQFDTWTDPLRKPRH